MWMTSSFRADPKSRLQPLLMAAFIAALAALTFVGQEVANASVVAQIAPDAPRPAKPQPAVERPPSRPYPRASVELKSVLARPLDEAMKKLAGAEFLRQATNPLYIQVQTEKPLGSLDRTAAPVIILNGEKLLDTRATAQDTLVAFLPDRQKLKDANTVEVVWLGDRATRTKKPLTFRREDVGR